MQPSRNESFLRRCLFTTSDNKTHFCISSLSPAAISPLSLRPPGCWKWNQPGQLFAVCVVVTWTAGTQVSFGSRIDWYFQMTCKSTNSKNLQCVLQYLASETPSFQTGCFTLKLCSHQCQLFCTVLKNRWPQSLPLHWPALTYVTTFDGSIQIKKICCLSMKQSAVIYRWLNHICRRSKVISQFKWNQNPHTFLNFFFFGGICQNCRVALASGFVYVELRYGALTLAKCPMLKGSNVVGHGTDCLPYDGNCQTPSISS